MRASNPSEVWPLEPGRADSCARRHARVAGRPTSPSRSPFARRHRHDSGSSSTRVDGTDSGVEGPWPFSDPASYKKWVAAGKKAKDVEPLG